jgi:hypothetical protein
MEPSSSFLSNEPGTGFFAPAELIFPQTYAFFGEQIGLCSYSYAEDHVDCGQCFQFYQNAIKKIQPYKVLPILAVALFRKSDMAPAPTLIVWFV